MTALDAIEDFANDVYRQRALPIRINDLHRTLIVRLLGDGVTVDRISQALTVALPDTATGGLLTYRLRHIVPATKGRSRELPQLPPADAYEPAAGPTPAYLEAKAQLFGEAS